MLDAREEGGRARDARAATPGQRERLGLVPDRRAAGPRLARDQQPEQTAYACSEMPRSVDGLACASGRAVLA